MSEGMPNKSSKYALEGTAAHALAEECLLFKNNPHSYINGGTVTIEDDDGEQIEYEVSANMATAVFEYIQEVTTTATSLGIDITEDMVEVGFHLDWIDEDLWGTNDLMIGVPFDTLRIYDYKHGQGVAVDVEENEQLMYYALGALGKDNPNCYADVELIIVQPRASHPAGTIRKWKISVEDLMEFKGKLLVGVLATRAGNPPISGGSHCRWCPGLSVCPEACKEAATITGLTAKQVFEEAKPLVLPNPKDISPEKRVRLYEFISQFEAWAKAVREDTHDKLLSGHDIPGLKVVRGKGSNAAYADKEAAEDVVVSLLGEEAFNKTLKTPTQAKKKVKSELAGFPAKQEVALATIDALLAPKTYGKTIALESDKRAALTIENAADAFAEK